MSEQSEKSVSAFTAGYNCAQAVFSALAPDIGVPQELASRLASGFGGGMARQGDTCGAVVGAMLAIGLAKGSAEPDEAAKMRVYSDIWRFTDEFRARHGSSVCRDLLGCDLGTEAGRKQAHDSGVTKQRCPGFVRSAVEIAEKIVR
jgi:C_GCAxxG_C_C family probable redox protein